MTPTIDFEKLASDLLADARTLLPQWLPGGSFQSDEYSCSDFSGGDGSSLRYNVIKGIGQDFATGETVGDMIDLYSKIKRLPMIQAARALSENTTTPRAPRTPAINKPASYIPEIPPDDSRPDMVHKANGEPSEYYQYTDLSNRLLFIIARYQTPSGKTFTPFTYSNSRWNLKAWPKPRHLYGLHLLTERPGSPVLLVEGEKSCHAARALLGDIYVVMTWSGGAAAHKQSDFTPLHGRSILLWPDADEPGRKAMADIAGQLLSHCPRVKILDVSDISDGWDAADADAAMWSKQDTLDWARPRARLIDKPETATHVPEIIDDGPPLDDPRFMEVISEDRQLTRDAGYQQSLGAIKLSLPFPPSKTGRIPNVIENLIYILNQMSITVRYNVIKKTEEILIPGKTFSIDNNANASFAWLKSECNKIGMPISQIGEYVTYIGDQNLFNPIANWITSKPWDGISRLDDIYATIVSTDDDLKKILMYRWMISAIAAAFNPKGVSAHGVLVLQGEQYLGKTAWFKSLVPREFEATADGMILRPDDKDSVKQICSYWMVELGELDATFKKSDMAQLKAFITKDRDKLRAAYANKESEYARRTVFFGSVNPKHFLNDDTGNRRFWTIECAAINHKHEIDMQQLWAEVHQIWQRGETWFLKPEEMQLLNAHNELFLAQDPVEESIRSDLDWSIDTVHWSWKTAKQLLNFLGFDRPSKGDLIKAGLVLAKIPGSTSDRTGGVNRRLVPPLKSQQTIFEKMRPNSNT